MRKAFLRGTRVQLACIAFVSLVLASLWPYVQLGLGLLLVMPTTVAFVLWIRGLYHPKSDVREERFRGVVSWLLGSWMVAETWAATLGSDPPWSIDYWTTIHDFGRSADAVLVTLASVGYVLAVLSVVAVVSLNIVAGRRERKN